MGIPQIIQVMDDHFTIENLVTLGSPIKNQTKKFPIHTIVFNNIPIISYYSMDNHTVIILLS